MWSERRRARHVPEATTDGAGPEESAPEGDPVSPLVVDAASGEVELPGPWRDGELDATAMRSAFRDHGGELYRVAIRLTADRQLAEELVQETFLRAWRARDRFDSARASPRTWLFSILRNLAVDADRARRLRPSEALPPDEIDAALGGDLAKEHLESTLLAWQVEEALRRIRPEHRQALVEVYLRDQRASDVASRLELPEGTVRSRCYYGLRSLRLVLEELGAVDRRAMRREQARGLRSGEGGARRSGDGLGVGGTEQP
jgi:RNA polymerase sigma-70 factor (ECF subfamily)